MCYVNHRSFGLDPQNSLTMDMRCYVHRLMIAGTVTYNVDLRPHLLLFLPQKPYLTDGSLRQQVNT